LASHIHFWYDPAKNLGNQLGFGGIAALKGIVNAHGCKGEDFGEVGQEGGSIAVFHGGEGCADAGFG
jgi:hypothetical protein